MILDKVNFFLSKILKLLKLSLSSKKAKLVFDWYREKAINHSTSTFKSVTFFYKSNA